MLFLFTYIDVGFPVDIDTKLYIKGTFFISYDNKNKNSNSLNNVNYLLMFNFPADTIKFLKLSIIDCEKLELIKKRDIHCENEEQFKNTLLIFIADQLRK